MRSAAVGFQSPSCVAEGSAGARSPRTVFGGPVVARPDIVTVSLIGANVAVFLLGLVAG